MKFPNNFPLRCYLIKCYFGIASVKTEDKLAKTGLIPVKVKFVDSCICQSKIRSFAHSILGHLFLKLSNYEHYIYHSCFCKSILWERFLSYSVLKFPSDDRNLQSYQ